MSTAYPPPPPGRITLLPDQEVAFSFTSALVYGIYLSTFVFTVRWLLFTDEGWSRRRNIFWPMVFVTSFIFAFLSAYTALTLKNSLDEVRLLMKNPGVNYVKPTWISVCLCMFSNVIALAADVILIYRCYVVYAKKLAIIALPCLLWIGGVACTGMQMYLQIVHTHNSNLGPYVWAAVNMAYGPGIALIPFWCSTTLINVYCTVALIRRIYQASRQSDTGAVAKQFRFVARSIAESGFLYSSISLAHFAVWFTPDNFAIQMVSLLNPPVIGIAFNLILIRAANIRTEDFGQKANMAYPSIVFDTNTALSTTDFRSGSKTLEIDSQPGTNTLGLDIRTEE